MKKTFLLIPLIIYLLSPFTVFGELNLTFYESNFLPITVEEFNNICQEIYKYECNRLDYFPELTLDVTFNNNDSCNIRGSVHGDSLKNKISLCIDKKFSKEKLYGVFAHELGHIIHFRWINSNRGTPISYFDEGFASWLAGKYYLRWHKKSDFKVAAGTIPSSDFIIIENTIYTFSVQPFKRDIIYIEWASFVDYLINQYSIKNIYDFCQYLNNLDIETSLEDVEMPKLTNLNELSDDDIKKHFATVKNKLFEEQIKRNKKYKDEFNLAYKKIFESEFEELKKMWLDSIAI